MKVKNKLIIIIITTFVLNIAILVAFYEYNTSSKMSNLIEEIQIGLNQKIDVIHKEIGQTGEIDNLNNILIDSDRVHYYFRVVDIDGNKLYEFGEEIKGALRCTSTKLVVVQGETYLIELKQMLPIDKVKNIPVTGELIKIEIIVLAIILLLLTFIIFKNFVKPLQSLQKDINNYKYGIKPTLTKRSDELGWLKNKFVILTEDLDDEKDKQNKIIASISHDIKTPLTSIMGYTERLKNSNLSQERKDRYIEVIYSKAQHINELIDEFDDYLSYNLESSINKEKIKISKLVSIVKEEFEDELEQLNVKLKINVDCKDRYINIDISKIRRVVGNIVGNSLKHMYKDEKIIEINIIEKDNKIKISILDNGCGVDEKEINNIFEALYTSDNSRKVAGLGLSICKRAIEAHNGEIWAENNTYGGLTVSFTLEIV